MSLGKLVQRASKSDLVVACRLLSEYYASCSRQKVPADNWRLVLLDSLQAAIINRRHHTRGKSGVSSSHEPRRDYSVNYRDDRKWS
jgi:hypothetical protein